MDAKKLDRIKYFAYSRNELESGDITTVFELLRYVDILKATSDTVVDALIDCERELRFMLTAHPERKGGKYEEALLKAQAALGPRPKKRVCSTCNGTGSYDTGLDGPNFPHFVPCRCGATTPKDE